jgi:hypothetical protein
MPPKAQPTTPNTPSTPRTAQRDTAEGPPTFISHEAFKSPFTGEELKDLNARGASSAGNLDLSDVVLPAVPGATRGPDSVRMSVRQSARADVNKRLEGLTSGGPHSTTDLALKLGKTAGAYNRVCETLRLLEHNKSEVYRSDDEADDADDADGAEGLSNASNSPRGSTEGALQQILKTLSTMEARMTGWETMVSTAPPGSNFRTSSGPPTPKRTRREDGANHVPTSIDELMAATSAHAVFPPHMSPSEALVQKALELRTPKQPVNSQRLNHTAALVPGLIELALAMKTSEVPFIASAANCSLRFFIMAIVDLRAAGIKQPTFVEIVAQVSTYSSPPQNHSFTTAQRETATADDFHLAMCHIQQLATAASCEWALKYASIAIHLKIAEPYASAWMLAEVEGLARSAMIASGSSSPFGDPSSSEFQAVVTRTITKPGEFIWKTQMARLAQQQRILGADAPSRHTPIATANTRNPRAHADKPTELCDRFNVGTCTKLACKYQHKCACCGSAHAVKDCKASGAGNALAKAKATLGTRDTKRIARA